MAEVIKIEGGASFTLQLHKDGIKHPVMVICPGGGYEFVSELEGEPIAEEFFKRGFHTAIVKYTVGSGLGAKPASDLAAAVRMLRERSEWKALIDPHKISAIGFSAGAHVVGMLAAMGPELSFLTPREHALSALNAAVFCYPVVSGMSFTHQGSFRNLCQDKSQWEKFSIELQVTEKFPPSFIWHTVEDETVPVENAMLLANELLKHHVPCELHLFSWGAHGLSLANKKMEQLTDKITADPHAAHWLELCLEWVKRTLDIKEEAPAL